MNPESDFASIIAQKQREQEEKQAAQARAKAAEEQRLILNRDKIRAVLEQSVVPVFMEASDQIISAGGYASVENTTVVSDGTRRITLVASLKANATVCSPQAIATLSYSADGESMAFKVSAGKISQMKTLPEITRDSVTQMVADFLKACL